MSPTTAQTPTASPTAPAGPAPPAPTPAPAGQIVRINSATMIMGPSGTGKSSLLYTLARWVFEKYGLISVLNTTDGGGFPTPVQALIGRGIIWPIRLRTRDNAAGDLSFETCLRAAQGWLPARFDPRTGQIEPGCRMVPPITEQHAMYCPNGHLIKTVQFASLLTPAMCPTCKVHTTAANMQVQKSMARTKGFETIGCVMFDGLSSMLTWMEQDLGQRAGRMEIKGEESALGGKVVSGDLKLGGTTRSHVGFVQSRAHELVLNSLSIPYLVVPPTWTGLTLETTDEGGLSIRGIKLSGRAKTDEAGAWFGNCLETAVVRSDKDEPIYRLLLSEFTDVGGVRHLIKHRGAPGTMPQYLEDPPLKGTIADADTAFTQFNLGVFFELLERSQQQTLNSIDAEFTNAPGLPGGLIEVGEPVLAAGTPAGQVPGRSVAAARPILAAPTPAVSVTAPPAGTGSPQTAGGAPAASSPPGSATAPAQVGPSTATIAHAAGPSPRPAAPRAPVARPKAAAPKPPAAAAAKPAAAPPVAAPAPVAEPAPLPQGETMTITDADIAVVTPEQLGLGPATSPAPAPPAVQAAQAAVVPTSTPTPAPGPPRAWAAPPVRRPAAPPAAVPPKH